MGTAIGHLASVPEHGFIGAESRFEGLKLNTAVERYRFLTGAWPTSLDKASSGFSLSRKERQSSLGVEYGTGEARTATACGSGTNPRSPERRNLDRGTRHPDPAPGRPSRLRRTPEILANDLNLAHACLLLRRGESDAVEKALELALRKTDPDSAVVAECIRVELLRLAGDLPRALARAEALARAQRFHPSRGAVPQEPLSPGGSGAPSDGFRRTRSGSGHIGSGRFQAPQSGDSQAPQERLEAVRETDIPAPGRRSRRTPAWSCSG